MKAGKVIVAFLMMFVMASGFTQHISRKEQREKDKIEKQHQVDSLINSKEFVFEATRALPQDGKSVDLAGNSYTVTFHPEKIESYMPFFGRAYNIEYGGRGGLMFEGKPDDYDVLVRKEGKGFEINATVKVSPESYKLMLFVSPDGNATLTINSNQRNPISYYGDITKFEMPKGK